MSVNSNVFGDPCPGTHKYVEVHYACSPQSTTTTTRRPLPPWFLENGADNLWINPKSPAGKEPPSTSRTSLETTASLTSPTTTSTTLTSSEQVTVLDSLLFKSRVDQIIAVWMVFNLGQFFDNFDLGYSALDVTWYKVLAMYNQGDF
jgi:hypothetical protein